MAPSTKTPFKAPSLSSGPKNPAYNTSSYFTLRNLLVSSILLRVVLLFYGLIQDATSPVKYTDIDYLVFTDASRFVARGGSPYDRATYRYTPLLSWLLIPTAWQPQWLFFAWGKVLFAIGDIVAGWLMIRILRRMGVNETSAMKYAAIWLLNPMVATISTRGSSEGLLGAMVIVLLWAAESGRTRLAAVALGVAVHFKIYPFIYAPTIIWWMDDARNGNSGNKQVVKTQTTMQKILGFITKERIEFAVISLATFMTLNGVMFAVYGMPFVEHTYLYHVTRSDHRHNFSPYNMLLYLSASPSYTNITASVASLSSTNASIFGVRFEKLAFLPQILLSTVILPLRYAKLHGLGSTMFLQTLAFVAFNKVCTSQYFIWYLVLFPIYLPNSGFVRERKTWGIMSLIAWAAGQGMWLSQGYELEFLGHSVFYPEMWVAGLVFFGVNVVILSMFMLDMDFPELL